MRLTVLQTAELLKQTRDVLILTHKNPDGDTLGSGYALMYALRALGKRAAVVCSDEIPAKYEYLNPEQVRQKFEPKFIVSVDIADSVLLGESLRRYENQIDLCIDHHLSNRGYARNLLLREDAAATCELMLDVIEAMGVSLNKQIADCLYTGLVTDTGCFRYPSVTADTHRAAQKLISAGAETTVIHQRMFESVSQNKVAFLIEVMKQIRYELNGECAILVLIRDTIHKFGVSEEELEGVSSIPRQIEGVRVGITIRQFRNYQGYKISVRTDGTVHASRICSAFGGGGHIAAAGCTVQNLPLDQIYSDLLRIVSQELQAGSVKETGE